MRLLRLYWSLIAAVQLKTLTLLSNRNMITALPSVTEETFRKCVA
jgi:hypothetical protein